MTDNKQYPELPTHFMLVQESFRDEVYLYTADQMRAYVDADRAMRAAQAAPAAVAEPVAWLHDDPQRYDVIHAEVKDLLVKFRDAAGYLHRPLDKAAHYTIPLYTAPAPAAQGDELPREEFAWMVVQEACETEPADEDDPECIRILRRDLKSAVLAAFLREDAARAAKEGEHD